MKRTVNRDSGTGKFVTEKFAKANKKTTQKESLPDPAKKKQTPKPKRKGSDRIC